MHELGKNLLKAQAMINTSRSHINFVHGALYLYSLNNDWLTMYYYGEVLGRVEETNYTFKLAAKTEIRTLILLSKQ